MNPDTDTLALLGAYRPAIDRECEKLLARGAHPMYGMMRYFMGYADEKLHPKQTSAGKRFRAALTLFIAEQYGALAAALPLAVSIEIFHNFTLIHDDIVDGDETRRGRPTVWKLWGADHALNTGDAQSLLAFLALVKPNEGQVSVPEGVSAFLIERYLEVTEGQYLDFVMSTKGLVDPSLTVGEYFEMIGKKTAALIGAATKSAGMMAGAPESEQELLYQYGFALGVAYQIADDIVSIWGVEAETGKPLRGDLREGKKTFPVLRAFNVLPESDKQRFAVMYASPNDLSEAEIETLFMLIEKTDAFEESLKHVEHFKSEALTAAMKLSLSDEAKQRLMALTTALIPPLPPRMTPQ